MSNNQEIQKGYICPYCQKFNEFSVWVFAHMHIEITHTCDCGKVIPLKNGEILFRQLDFSIDDLDSDQAIMYNSLVMMLNNKKKENPDTPFGDVFFDVFGKMIYDGKKPAYLSSLKKKTVMKKIESDLIRYILEIV